MPIKIQPRQLGPIGIPAVAQAPAPSGRGVAAIGAGITKVAEAAQTILFKERERQDSSVLMNANAQIGLARIQQETEFFKLKGQDALEGAESSEAAYAAEVARITSDISSDRVRSRFAAIALRHGTQFQKSIMSHQAREGESMYQDNYAATNILARQEAAHAIDAMIELGGAGFQEGIREAIQNALLAASLKDSQDMMEDAVAAHVDREGMTPKQAKAHELEKSTAYHVSVIDSLLRKTSMAGLAKSWLKDANSKKEIDKGIVGQLRDKIDAGLDEGRALKLSNDAIQRATISLESRPLGPFDVDAQQLFREIRENPELRDDSKKLTAALNNAKSFIGERNVARRANDEPKIAAVKIDILRGKPLNRNSREYQNSSAIGRAALENLEAARIRALRASREGDKLSTSEQSRINRTYIALLRKMPTQQLRSLRKGGGAAAFSMADELGAALIEEKIEAILDGRGKNRDAVQREAERLSRRKYKGKDEEDDLKRDSFVEYVTDRYDSLKKSLGSEPTPKEVAKIFADAKREELQVETLFRIDYLWPDSTVEHWVAVEQGTIEETPFLSPVEDVSQADLDAAAQFYNDAGQIVPPKEELVGKIREARQIKALRAFEAIGR